MNPISFLIWQEIFKQKLTPSQFDALPAKEQQGLFNELRFQLKSEIVYTSDVSKDRLANFKILEKKLDDILFS